jgi:membrane fusion protein, multidrug efflux system
MATMLETPEIELADRDLGAAPGQRESGTRPPRRKPVPKLLLTVLLAAVAAGALLLYRYYAHWESTDDAQIDGYVYPVSARVGGYVLRVMVNDNQYVQAGTVLVQLDPKDYEVAAATAKAMLANDQASSAAAGVVVPLTSVNTSSMLATAQADVDSVRAAVVAAQHQFEAAQATLRQAEANDLRAQDDVNRFKPLAEKDEISQQQFTQALDAQKATAAAVEAARHAAAAAEQAVTQAQARVSQAQAQLTYAETRPQQISVQRSRARAAEAETERASAALEQAELNLQYATIVAPVSGVVGQRTVQPGRVIAPGQQLMAIVPLDSQNLWVTANFKETQLKFMRPGQAVDIAVDTYGRTYKGHVDSIAGASGSRFSLLPPENATGNYVKVVQRIPVKILLDGGQDPEHLLRPGMSVEPKVRVR